MSLSRETKQHKVTDPSPDYLMGDLLMKKDYIESDVWVCTLLSLSCSLPHSEICLLWVLFHISLSNVYPVSLRLYII